MLGDAEEPDPAVAALSSCVASIAHITALRPTQGERASSARRRRPVAGFCSTGAGRGMIGAWRLARIFADRMMHGGVQRTSQHRPRGFGRSHDRADGEQREMPIPAFVSEVPAARVPPFEDSARAKEAH